MAAIYYKSNSLYELKLLEQEINTAKENKDEIETDCGRFNFGLEYYSSINTNPQYIVDITDRFDVIVGYCKITKKYMLEIYF
jgi:hypothetical protein